MLVIFWPKSSCPTNPVILTLPPKEGIGDISGFIPADFQHGLASYSNSNPLFSSKFFTFNTCHPTSFILLLAARTSLLVELRLALIVTSHLQNKVFNAISVSTPCFGPSGHLRSLGQNLKVNAFFISFRAITWHPSKTEWQLEIQLWPLWQ